jgi:hypothetical protein
MERNCSNGCLSILTNVLDVASGLIISSDFAPFTSFILQNEFTRRCRVNFHRRLRCLVIIDLKIGKFAHSDAGQMHLYLNYAKEHWVHADENPPVGLILCARKDEAVARYALEGLPNKVMAAEYRTALPGEKELAAEIERTQAMLQDRKRLSLVSAIAPAAKKGAKKETP